MSNYPQHITNIVAELQFGYEAEDVLLRHVSLINKDTQLYKLYTELSFDYENKQFTRAPTNQHTFERIKECYTTEDNFDWFAVDLQPNIYRSENSIDYANLLGFEQLAPAESSYLSNLWDESSMTKNNVLDMAPEMHKQLIPLSQSTEPTCTGNLKVRSKYGLKLLSIRVKDVVRAKSFINYSEIADYLIADMNVQNSQEENNIRRRVYDALNVLKSAKVINKTGKTVTWNQFLPTPCRMTIIMDQQQLHRLKTGIAAKKEMISQLLNKIGKFNGLIERSKKQSKREDDSFQFPYIIIATSETAVRQMSVNFNSTNSSVCIGM